MGVSPSLDVLQPIAFLLTAQIRSVFTEPRKTRSSELIRSLKESRQESPKHLIRIWCRGLPHEIA